MAYVEWLRVRNVLRIVGIVLAAIIVIVGILRVSTLRWENVDSQINKLKADPGTRVSTTVLPDGTHRMVIDDPKKRTHVVIDDLGYQGKRIVITEPQSMSHTMHNHQVVVGSVSVHESRNARTTTTVIETNTATPFIYYMGFADVVALIVATVLGAPFARENDGHLELTLTRPISRTGYALEVFVADIAGIIAASVVTLIAVLICQSMFELPRVDAAGVNAQAVIMGVVLPITWYAMLCAATTSMSRGYGAILGLAWPVAILVPVLGAISWGGSIIAQILHYLFWLISRIDPLAYVKFPDTSAPVGTAAGLAPNFAPRIAILLVLLIIYAFAAIVQWRRVEA